MSVLSDKYTNCLKSLGIPYRSIMLLGSIVHIDCKGEETAEKWFRVLAQAKCTRIQKKSALVPNKEFEHLPNMKPHHKIWKIKAFVY